VQLLDALLDLRHIAVALVREENLGAGDADVAPHQIAAAQERDDLLGLAGMLEGAREQVAESRRHRQEGHRQPDRGLGHRAHRRVTADRHEMRERRGGRPRPPHELAQTAKHLHARRVAFLLEPFAHVTSDEEAATIARAGGHDDVNPFRHRWRSGGRSCDRAGDHGRRSSRT